MFAYYLGAMGIEYVCILLLEITKNATDMKKNVVENLAQAN